MTAATPTPLYKRVADAVTTALIVALVGAATLGLTRYNDARDHRRAVEARVGEKADRLALAVAKLGPRAAEEGRDDLATVDVVTTGDTDEFGISVGAGVPVSRVLDAAARPADPAVYRQALLNRSAELESYTEHHQPIPADRRFAAAELKGGDVLFAAYAPVLDDGHYAGLVRISERVKTPPPSTPTWLLLLFVALALGLGYAASYLGRPKRYAIGLLAGLAVAFTLAAQPLGLIFWPALTAAALGIASGPGIARVIAGLREQPTAYAYIVPAMLGMVVLVFVPFIMGVGLAFFSHGDFTGFDNFKEILLPEATAHPNFYWTTGVTIAWTVSNVFLHVSIGVALALVLNRPNLRLKSLYRVLLIVPWAVPNYITALIWKSMFNTQYGAVNGILDVIGIEKVSWLGPGSSFASNFVANLTTNVWLGFPFMMVVTLGALQSIPKDLYEAADIDGASRWQRFRQVTVPLLKPALVPAVILGVVWTFNMFNVIYLVSGGGPENETNILITQAYYAFKVLNRYGLAAAYSVLIFVMLLAYGWLQNRITRATEGAFE